MSAVVTRSGDVVEDAQQQSPGDATGPSHRSVQLGQGPVELLGLFGAHGHAEFLLLLHGHSVAADASRCMWPRMTGGGEWRKATITFSGQDYDSQQSVTLTFPPMDNLK